MFYKKILFCFFLTKVPAVQLDSNKKRINNSNFL